MLSLEAPPSSGVWEHAPREKKRPLRLHFRPIFSVDFEATIAIFSTQTGKSVCVGICIILIIFSTF